ncbi:hypothetical protein T492DRAFT_871380 [Pavlovales sp. CCMP2436]|nr:hypothetical protein T492DRAFT_871380 [Pavlovales sp. CCMP2436]
MPAGGSLSLRPLSAGARSERRVAAPRSATLVRHPLRATPIQPSTRLRHAEGARHPTSPLRGVPLHVALGAAYAPHCSVSTGPGLLSAVAGTTAQVLVVMRDVDNRRLGGGGASVLRAHVSGPARSHVQACNNGDGTYAVVYCCAVSGSYALRITLTSTPPSGEPPYEEHIRGSPFRLTVHDVRSRALRYELYFANPPSLAELAAHASDSAARRGLYYPLLELSEGALPTALPTRREVVVGGNVELEICGVGGETAWPGERFTVCVTAEEGDALGAYGSVWGEEEERGLPLPRPEPRVGVTDAGDGREMICWLLFVVFPRWAAIEASALKRASSS